MRPQILDVKNMPKTNQMNPLETYCVGITLKLFVKGATYVSVSAQLALNIHPNETPDASNMLLHNNDADMCTKLVILKMF